MAEINYYKCCRCGEMTRQIEVTMRELSALEGAKWYEQAMMTLNDLDGISLVFRKTGILRPFKCTKCGRVSDRAYSGEDKGYLAG